MAHTKGKGSTKNLRDSQAKRLGVKVFGSQNVFPGAILVRQRGSKFFAGEGVGRGGDDSLFAQAGGTVRFAVKTIKKYNGQWRRKTVVRVEPVSEK